MAASEQMAVIVYGDPTMRFWLAMRMIEHWLVLREQNELSATI
jgi:hypothetical protein